MTMCEPWTILFQLYPVHDLKIECKPASAFQGFEKHPSYLDWKNCLNFSFSPIFIQLFFIPTDMKSS